MATCTARRLLAGEWQPRCIGLAAMSMLLQHARGRGIGGRQEPGLHSPACASCPLACALRDGQAGIGRRRTAQSSVQRQRQHEKGEPAPYPCGAALPATVSTPNLWRSAPSTIPCPPNYQSIALAPLRVASGLMSRRGGTACGETRSLWNSSKPRGAKLPPPWLSSPLTNSSTSAPQTLRAALRSLPRVVTSLFRSLLHSNAQEHGSCGV